MALDLEQARRTVSVQLSEMIVRDESLFFARRKQEFRRGIDFYTVTSFLDVLTEAAALFNEKQGRYPQLLNPERFSDKIFWSKFFTEFKVPETGNKLLNDFFIPDTTRDIICVPPIVWTSKLAVLPEPGIIADGIYYLKTNHGCNMYRRLQFPIPAVDREAIEREFGDYLRYRYGMRNGEWWYNSFEPEIFLEKSVSGASNSITWNHFVFGGKVELIGVFRKVGEGAEATILDPNFNLIEFQNPNRERVQCDMPSPAMRMKMRRAAEEIGAQFPFVRVDLLTSEQDELFLSEVTFTPGAGLTYWPDDLDHELGVLWKVP